MYIESIKKLLFIYLNFAPLQTQAYSYIRFNDHGGFQITTLHPKIKKIIKKLKGWKTAKNAKELQPKTHCIHLHLPRRYVNHVNSAAVRPLLKITHVRIPHGINSLSVKTINWSIAPRGIISITGGHLLPTLSGVNKVIKTKDVIWVIGCKFLPHA